MKLQAIKKALILALKSPDLKSDDQDLIVEAYDEVLQLNHHLTEYDCDPDFLHEVRIITDYALFNLLNECIYDDVGITLRSEGFVQKNVLLGVIHNRHDLYELQTSYIMDAANTIRDLWQDNDSIQLECGFPVHNQDGSYAKTGDSILYKAFHKTLTDGRAIDRFAQCHSLDAFERVHLKNILHKGGSYEQD